MPRRERVRFVAGTEPHDRLMVRLTENEVEDTAFAWLDGLVYAAEHEPDIGSKGLTLK